MDPSAGNRVAFATVGCRVNRADTLRLQAALPPGAHEVAFHEPADLYVINTCTVTSVADRDSRRLIYRARRRNPEARILVTGCLAELRPEALTGRVDGVDVVPNTGKDGLASRIADILSLPRPELPDVPPVYRPREVTRPPLKIQDGCAHQCTFCTVAAARGRPRSLPPEVVLAKLGAYGKQGCPEVVLAGIDIGSYGRDLEPPTSLAEILAGLVKARPVGRLRLSSLEIMGLDDPLLEVLATAGDAICRHLHLPLQSGSDRVLDRMARPYDAATYEARIRAARAALPEVCLGADVIAGFPGERDEDHQATIALLETLEISYLHVFPFSPRPGTAAARFTDPVEPEVIRARARELRTLGEQFSQRFRLARVGRETSGVVYHRRSQGWLTAFTDQGFAVRVPGPDSLQGKTIRLRPTGLDAGGLVGEAILE